MDRRAERRKGGGALHTRHRACFLRFHDVFARNRTTRAAVEYGGSTFSPETIASRRRCRGTSAISYEVTIDWREGERRLRSVCDCPIGRSCKHGAAAAILAAEGGMRDAADGAVDSWLQAITSRRFEGTEPRREHVLYVLDVRESSTFRASR